MIFAAHHAHRLIELKQVFYLIQAGLRDLVCTDHDGHQDQYRVLLVEEVVDFIQKYVSLEADVYSKLIDRSLPVADVPEDERYSLWTVPLAGIHSEILLCLLAYAVDAEGADRVLVVVWRRVVHE